MFCSSYVAVLIALWLWFRSWLNYERKFYQVFSPRRKDCVEGFSVLRAACCGVNYLVVLSSNNAKKGIKGKRSVLEGFL